MAARIDSTPGTKARPVPPSFTNVTIEDAIRIVRAHLETQFPKACSCGKVFTSLRDYLLNTKHLGEPLSYDAELGDLAPRTPIGTMSFANCVCGSTIALTSKGMSRVTLLRLMAWGFAETARRRISFSALLAEVRDGIDARVFAEAAPGDALAARPHGAGLLR